MRDIPQLEVEAEKEEPKKPASTSLLSWFKFFQKDEEPKHSDDKEQVEKGNDPAVAERDLSDETDAKKSASAEETAIKTTEEEEEEEEEGWQMTKKQKQHAFMILNEVPRLNELRRQLVPKKLSEEDFWRVYFFLVGNKLGHILEDDYDEEIKYDYRRYSLMYKRSFANEQKDQERTQLTLISSIFLLMFNYFKENQR